MTQTPAVRTGDKPLAIETMRSIQAGTVTASLLALYRRAAAGNLTDQQGRTWPGLTDLEAAAALNVRRTTINASRHALRKAGHRVVSFRRRICRHDPRGKVNAWGLLTDGSRSLLASLAPTGGTTP